ncbi:MAG: pyridoxamine 5'-phosphate oxidase family protein [Mycobacterium sp.]|nr:pyridoxamine 5'-phosphate oxidase family protein [Mycobacterium sp.]
MRTKKNVDVGRLAAALADYPYAYLITVDEGYRVHTVTVQPQLRERAEGADGGGAILDVGPIGGHTRENLCHRHEVTLLWPPPQAGGYSLIVDGRAEMSDAAALGIVPTRALLHRDADPETPGGARGCLHDCVVFSLPA